MICWSCERAGGDGPTCVACGAILPPDRALDHFAVLGVPATYAVDLTTAEARFRDLSRRFHPDRFATADPRARRASLQRSVQLNESWRTVKDPVSRAEYLLRLGGYDIGAESGASRPARTTSGEPADAAAANAEPSAEGGAARERMAVPAVLLGEILELREELADARAGGDDVRIQSLARDVRGRAGAAEARVASAFGGVSVGAVASRDVLEVAARELIAIRYYRRFLDEVAAHEEAQAVRNESVSRA